jgi:hypothetical protein
MRIQPNQIVSLGYGKYARSDDVVAVEAIQQGRGPGRRALVWVRGLDAPIVASRSETARSVLQHLVRTVDEIPGTLRRRLRERDGLDLDTLADEASRAIA